MIIEKADYAVFSDNRPLTGLKLVGPKGPDNDDDFDGGVAPAPVERPVEGMFNLDPLERYRYMFEQGQQVKLGNVAADPQKTIERANQVINQAIMPPAGDNPGRTELLRALQLKRLAEGRLDIAA
ncbi:MAG: hypothetical protein CVV42_00085 [Candidatus Riflebacteria bacterium HGW-Riflebacteria-2]|nr:MAG: hypothetical protein CVV42_00085 [Candidatus Riflebacteria bacterium HGW-Riflebacteria-2]